MNQDQIEELRYASRKLVRELGMLQLNHEKQTPSHWHALIEISRSPGITISQLSSLLLLSASNMSRVVGALLKEELVTFQDGLDRREKRILLTKKGEQEIKIIDQFSNSKIVGAFAHLSSKEQDQIVSSIEKYANALETSRISQEEIKIGIHTLSTSRTLRRQVVGLIEGIQKGEYSIKIDPDANSCVMRAEEDFCYNHSCNFWYAVDQKGEIVGSIGLKKIDAKCGEMKKFFVHKEYRGKGVAQKLFATLMEAAVKHRFSWIYLGTIEELKAAQKFYKKCGFIQIPKSQLPKQYMAFPLDNVFFKGSVEKLRASCAAQG